MQVGLPGNPDRVLLRLDRVVPPAIEEVERVAMEFRRQFGSLDARTTFAGELLLREALLNAVLHGSRGDPAKTVRCVARARNGNLLILVRDKGDGFDWRTALGRVAGAREQRGRGLEIFRTYASRVRFSPRGNQVALVRRGPQDLEREQSK